MAVNYCRCQLARRFGWASPAYDKKEGATLHPLAYKHYLQHDGRLDRRFGVLVWKGNLGSLTGKGVEVCEELRKRMIDVCCLQEVRWRGHGARMLGMKGWRCKQWWSEKEMELVVWEL